MLTGICDICGRPGELNNCKKCGKRVCGRHYHDGVCNHCSAEEKSAIGGSELSVPDSAKPTTVSPKDVRK